MKLHYSYIEWTINRSVFKEHHSNDFLWKIIVMYMNVYLYIKCQIPKNKGHLNDLKICHILFRWFIFADGHLNIPWCCFKRLWYVFSRRLSHQQNMSARVNLRSMCEGHLSFYNINISPELCLLYSHYVCCVVNCCSIQSKG